MIAIKDSIAFKLHEAISDPQGRFLILICDICVTFVMLCGDFNITPDPRIDSTVSPKITLPSLAEALRSHDLFDSWRCLNAGERDYSFFSNSHRTYSRIDLFLVDKWLLFNCKKADINVITWLDHASITLTVEDSSSHNPTYNWRANPRLFQDAPTKARIVKLIKEFF